MTYHKHAEELLKVSLFAGCSKRDVAGLARACRVEQLEAGQVLLAEGSPSSNLYIILAGSAEVWHHGERVATLERGEVVGELGVILGEPRRASVKAATPMELMALDQASLQEALNTVPGLGWKMLQTVARRLARYQA